METTYYFSHNKRGIMNDPFFQELNLLFKNGRKHNGSFELFDNQTKVPYPLDVWYNSQFYVIEIPILDAKREDIKITRKLDWLVIDYTRSTKEAEDAKKWVKRSIIKRDFTLEWKIPSGLEYSNLQSVFENGILTIYVPFAKEAKPEEVPILDTNANWKKVAMGEPLAEVKVNSVGKDFGKGTPLTEEEFKIGTHKPKQ